MDKRLNYIDVLLKNALNMKKKNALFISISNTEKEIALEIEKKAKQMGVEDIFIFYNDLKLDNNKISEYIEKHAKFLFFASENKEDLNMYMINDLLNNDIDIDYTIAVLPNSKSVSEDMLYNLSSISDKDAVENWNNIITSNNNIVSQLKNYKLNILKIESLLDTELTMRMTREVFGNNENKKMRLFPNYKIELIPERDTVQGFITSSAPITIGTTKVEELRLFISNGKIVDYDCAKGYEALNKVLYHKFKPVVEAIGLIDKDKPTYKIYDTFNNIVLDRTSNPYVLISSYDELNEEKNLLYVPIGTGTLKVNGYNEKGKNIPIYEEEGFSKQIVPNKK